jgi:lauroyl/myristoyl acyltransferase
LGDRDFTQTAPLQPFFGRPAPIPDGPARLAFAAQVPIYPAFCYPSPSPHLQILPPLRPADYPSPAALQTALRPLLQTAIAAAPTHWYAFTPFFPPLS